MHSHALLLRWVLVVLLALGWASSVAAADVTVFAAASLKEALDEQSRLFEASSGNKVVISYGASNALAKQIESGAPADLFISADLDWMDYVDQRHLLAPDTRLNLLRNTLVLIAPASSKATLKVAPWPGSLCTEIRPWLASTIGSVSSYCCDWRRPSRWSSSAHPMTLREKASSMTAR